jgi:hypothetical protein
MEQITGYVQVSQHAMAACTSLAVGFCNSPARNNNNMGNRHSLSLQSRKTCQQAFTNVL